MALRTLPEMPLDLAAGMEEELAEISRALLRNKAEMDNLERERAHLRERLFTLLDKLGLESSTLPVPATGMRLGRELRTVRKGSWDEEALRLVLGRGYDLVSDWVQRLNPEKLESAIREGALGVSEEEVRRCYVPDRKSPYLVHSPMREEEP
jgi:hypothetical protein